MKVVAHLITAEDGSRVIRLGEPGTDPLSGKIFDIHLDRPIKTVEVFAEGETLDVINAVTKGYEEGKLIGAQTIGQLSVLEDIVRLFKGMQFP